MVLADLGFEIGAPRSGQRQRRARSTTRATSPRRRSGLAKPTQHWLGCATLSPDSFRNVKPSAFGCEECLQIGSPWVHLRLCRTCGHVGCCDDSPNRHATTFTRRGTRSSKVTTRPRAGAGAISMRSYSASIGHQCPPIPAGAALLCTSLALPGKRMAGHGNGNHPNAGNVKASKTLGVPSVPACHPIQCRQEGVCASLLYPDAPGIEAAQ
jgi:hypothetical protein